MTAPFPGWGKRCRAGGRDGIIVGFGTGRAHLRAEPRLLLYVEHTPGEGSREYLATDVEVLPDRPALNDPTVIDAEETP